MNTVRCTYRLSGANRWCGDTGELGILIPKLTGQGIEVQLVTSAVRPIPSEWASIDNLHLVVSIDGLQPEHDARRFPATYERILKNIAAHQVIVHCTITRRMPEQERISGAICPLLVGSPRKRARSGSAYTRRRRAIVRKSVCSPRIA